MTTSAATKYSWVELDRLSVILEDEIEGRPVDPAEARQLANRLAEMCPGIASTMDRIVRRMERRA